MFPNADAATVMPAPLSFQPGELGDRLDLILVRLANFFPSEKFDGVKQGLTVHSSDKIHYTRRIRICILHHLTSSYIILAFVICRFPYISIHFHHFASRGYAFKMGEDGLGYYHDELLGAEGTVDLYVSRKKKAETWYFSRMTGVLGE